MRLVGPLMASPREVTPLITTKKLPEAVIHNTTVSRVYRIIRVLFSTVFNCSGFPGHSLLDVVLLTVLNEIRSSPLSTVHSAAGALRNLSLVSADACDEMIKQDVMTPLCALLANRFASGWTPAKKEFATKKLRMKGGIDSMAEIFIEAVNLLWNLCEANANALATFNRENLCDLLLTHLNAVKFGYE